MEQPGNLRDYVYNFIIYLVRVVIAGNFLDLEKGQ